MRFFKSFKYAFRGIVYCINNERNMRIHIVVAIYVLYFSGFYSLSVNRFCLLIAVIALVMALELLNTAVERACDAIQTEISPLIKMAKDVAAGAVLVAAVGSVFIGVLLFWDTEVLWNIVSYLCNSPEYLAIFVLSLLISALFVLIGPKGIVDNVHSIVELKREMKQEEAEAEKKP